MPPTETLLARKIPDFSVPSDLNDVVVQFEGNRVERFESKYRNRLYFRTKDGQSCVSMEVCGQDGVGISNDEWRNFFSITGLCVTLERGSHKDVFFIPRTCEKLLEVIPKKSEKINRSRDCGKLLDQILDPYFEIVSKLKSGTPFSASVIFGQNGFPLEPFSNKRCSEISTDIFGLPYPTQAGQSELLEEALRQNPGPPPVDLPERSR